MARIRTIKPEFWTNERVMECSINARLMFIGMWNFADDLGRLSLSAKTIKAQIFPSDDISSDTILGMISELSRNGLILRYEVEGREYLQIVGWQHQRIDKPQPGKCPGPVNGYSKNDQGMVATEGKGKESKGDAVADGARASGALVTPEAMNLAEKLLVLAGHDPKFWPPGWCGAPMRVQTWLSQGWRAGIIIAAVTSAAARKTGPPAETVQYFEKAIAAEVARQAAPL